MKLIDRADDTLKYNRFSANEGGFHTVELYQYKHNDDIIKITKDYLGDVLRK